MESPSMSSLHPGNNNTSSADTSWDYHYKRRGRTRERFDYAYTSEELSPESPHYSNNNVPMDAPGSNGRPRPSSADSRPQYHHRYHNNNNNHSGKSMTTSGSVSSSKNRTACLNNMFYPGETSSSSLVNHDDTSYQYYPSEIPEYHAIYHDDDGVYATSDISSNRQRAMGRMATRTTTKSTRDDGSPGIALGGSLTPTRLRAGTSTSANNEHPSYSSHRSQNKRDRLSYDYMKENFIMFGDGLATNNNSGGVTGTMMNDDSTGLSQEELLQRKRREDTWHKRREKRQQHKKAKKQQQQQRVVNLPSNLFSNRHTTSRQPNTQQQQQERQRQQQQLQQVEETVYKDIDMEDDARQSQSEPSNSNLEEVTRSESSSSKAVHQDNETDKDRRNSVTNNYGVRGSMVRRQRNDSSSSGRRWKIIPSLVGKSRLENALDSPTGKRNIHRKQDPPAPSASSRSIYPLDPPSVHSDDFPATSERSNTVSDSNDKEADYGKVGLDDFIGDEFDRFMENRDHKVLTSAKTVKFDPKIDDAADDYLNLSKVSERSSPMRPSYADFTPRSGYSSSRTFLSPDDKQTMVKETSPTSVMNIPNSNVSGVRWSENLTTQQYVSPQFTTPDFVSPQRVGIEAKPKSILRRRYLSSSASPENGTSVLISSKLDKEVPFDESPSKAENANRTVSDPPVGIGQLVSDTVGFVDGHGRSVSPILGESPTPELEVVKEIDDWPGVPRWNGDNDKSFERNIPSEYQEAFFSDNQQNNEKGQFSSSYVNFIEAVASVVIQTKVRQLLARIKVQRLKDQNVELSNDITGKSQEQLSFETRTGPMLRRSQALTKKARLASKSNASPKKGKALDFYALAAIRIQAVFRGWWVRDCLAVDNYCSTMIQKTYRGWLAVDKSITRMYCIVRIQSIIRGYLVRKQLVDSSEEPDVYDLAATMIQAQWRSFACEMRYLRAYEDILVVQSVVRGWITRRLIHSWLRAHNGLAPHALQKQRRTVSSRKTSVKVQPQQVTPPRKPSQLRNEISPSYKPHIEYMRKTLTPGSKEPKTVPFQLGLPGNNQHSIPTVDQMHFVTDNSTTALKTNAKRKKITGSASRESRHAKSKATGMDEDVPMDEDIPLQQNISQNSKTVQPFDSAKKPTAARTEIEKRRKHKELDSRAKQEEELRRQEAQAAELAELEFRRKRMAMKAEARKKQEKAELHKQEGIKDDSNPREVFLHDEEKKESDSIIQNAQDFESNPTTKSYKSDADFVDSHDNHFGGDDIDNVEADNDKSRKDSQNERSHEHVKGPVHKPKESLSISNEYKHNLAKKSKSDFTDINISSNGGIIAARKRQLFVTNGTRSAPVDSFVTSIDIEEMNSIVAQTSKRKDDTEDDDRRGEDPEDPDLGTNILPSPKTHKPFSLKKEESESDLKASPRTKDVDVSALTEPASVAEMSKVTPKKRVSTTNATFQDQMRSQRSESEQKRIDEIHAIFQKAGLMFRVKKSSTPSYSQSAYVEDQASARDLLMSWQGKIQTQSENTGNYFEK